MLSLKSLLSNTITILVTAQDHGVPQKSAQVSVVFYVVPPNLNFPQFIGNASSFTIIVLENQPIGSVIGSVQAVDSDQGASGVVVYNISAGNTNDTFAVDFSGNISLNKALDYEWLSRFVLEITAMDSSVIPNMSKQNITVFVTNVAKTPPVFTSAIYETSVTEDIPTESSITRVLATNQDGDEFFPVRYSLIGGSAAVEKFKIDSETGIVSTCGELRYEQTSQYRLIVLAAPDANAYVNSSVAIVIVNVTSANKYAPKFTKSSYTFGLTTTIVTGDTLGYVTATDNDTGFYSLIEYFLIGDSNLQGLSINSQSGAVVVSNAGLLRSVANLSVLVIAKNLAPIRATSATLNLTLSSGRNFDVCSIVLLFQNAATPIQFIRSLYQVTVPIDSPIGFQVIQISAASVANASPLVISYRIANGNVGNMFMLNSSTGWISVSYKLTGTVVNLTLSATTGTTVSLTGRKA